MSQFTDLLQDKRLLTGSSALALALSMGAAPAHADLITTSFTGAQTQSLNDGNKVYFGPASDPNGFYANNSNSDGLEFFNLTGVGPNGVAVGSPCTAGCKLQTFSPGEQVDGTSNFQSTGEFKTAGMDANANGNYYFGLDDVGSTPDPYGWAEITLDNGAVTLDKFAFENNSDPAPIPTDVPEPWTLPVFAIGAAAVLVRRRKTKLSKSLC